MKTCGLATSWVVVTRENGAVGQLMEAGGASTNGNVAWRVGLAGRNHQLRRAASVDGFRMVSGGAGTSYPVARAERSARPALWASASPESLQPR